MKIFLVFVTTLCLGASLNAQVKELDKLEMLYDQGHYKMTLRKAKRLLDKPDFDFSVLPRYYKSLCLFQLAQNERWFRRHKNVLNEAEADLMDVIQSPSWPALYKSHIFELKALKVDLYSFGEELAAEGKRNEAEQLKNVLQNVFGKVPNFEEQIVVNESSTPPVSSSTGPRDLIVNEAHKHEGVPYKWAGTTPSGFDCSGFTTYVYETRNVQLPRRAADQFKAGKKVKRSQAQKGDLVFFNNGKGISHVGIIISEKGSPLVMIHASSSKGITVTNIESSSYWKNKVAGFTTYF